MKEEAWVGLIRKINTAFLLLFGFIAISFWMMLLVDLNPSWLELAILTLIALYGLVVGLVFILLYVMRKS